MNYSTLCHYAFERSRLVIQVEADVAVLLYLVYFFLSAQRAYIPR